MIDIQKIFDEIVKPDVFKKLKLDNCPVGVYCGNRNNELPSLAFMTQTPPVNIESTQYLQVSQWIEKESVCWSRFDLGLGSARTIFYALCVDLINASIGCSNEEQAMLAVKNRYMVWRKMFRKASVSMTEESYKGLFGELYFLKHYLAKKIGIDSAVKSWSGPDMSAKDYSYDEEWYEIKTISAHSNSVSISSLAQLDSLVPGHLVVIKTEQMSEEYDDGNSSVPQLIFGLLKEIEDEEVKDMFMEKVLLYGFDLEAGERDFHRYRVVNQKFYLVDDRFPRLTEEKVPYEEVEKVSYSLSLAGIQKYLEDTYDFGG